MTRTLTKILLLVCILVMTLGYSVLGGGGGITPPITVYIENPADTELFESVMHFDNDATATKIHCQCFGGGSFEATWLIDGATVRDSGDGDIVCDLEEEDDTLDGTTAFPAGSDLDLRLDEKDGVVLVCVFQLHYEYD